MKHLISTADLSCNEIKEIFELCAQLKKQQKSGISHQILKGKTLGMIFSKSSTRTRVSFDAGMFQLGGHAIFLSTNDIQLGRGETIEDTAKVLSRYVDGIMIRTSSHKQVMELAHFSDIPVINGLTDFVHPCQVLTDIFTLLEIRGSLEGTKIAYVGDGNNVANSLINCCSKLGIDISIATPEDYDCDKDILKKADAFAIQSGCKIEILRDPAKAVIDADVVYTDTWVSMGQEDEKDQRIKTFHPYQVNKELFSLAKNDAVFMHCLPAYRGLEVTSDVIDGPRSVVFDEAENRLHVQKAIMAILMNSR